MYFKKNRSILTITYTVSNLIVFLFQSLNLYGICLIILLNSSIFLFASGSVFHCFYDPAFSLFPIFFILYSRSLPIFLRKIFIFLFFIFFEAGSCIFTFLFFLIYISTFSKPNASLPNPVHIILLSWRIKCKKCKQLNVKNVNNYAFPLDSPKIMPVAIR